MKLHKKNNTKSGWGANAPHKWWDHENRMDFILKSITADKSTSNLDEGPTSEDNGCIDETLNLEGYEIDFSIDDVSLFLLT